MRVLLPVTGIIVSLVGITNLQTWVLLHFFALSNLVSELGLVQALQVNFERNLSLEQAHVVTRSGCYRTDIQLESIVLCKWNVLDGVNPLQYVAAHQRRVVLQDVHLNGITAEGVVVKVELADFLSIFLWIAQVHPCLLLIQTIGQLLVGQGTFLYADRNRIGLGELDQLLPACAIVLVQIAM